MVSGLEVASAILTKYKYEDQEKPVLRPYTPTSDEGESICALKIRCYFCKHERS